MSELSPTAHFNLQNGDMCEFTMKDVCLCVEESDSSNCNLKTEELYRTGVIVIYG